MEKLHVKFIKWLSNKFGYKIAIIKIGGEVPGLTIDGDKELLRYVDITGYAFKKDPLKRTDPKFIPQKNLVVRFVKMRENQRMSILLIT